MNKNEKKAEIEAKIRHYDAICSLNEYEGMICNELSEYIENMRKARIKSNKMVIKKAIKYLKFAIDDENEKLNDYDLKAQMMLDRNECHLNYLDCKSLLHAAKYLNNPIAKVNKKDQLSKKQIQGLKTAMVDDKKRELE